MFLRSPGSKAGVNTMNFDEQDGHSAAPDQMGGCHMCLAIPGKIVEISSENANAALVDVMGVRRHVDLGLLEDDRPAPGEWVLIHVGYAMSKISETDATEQMRTLELLGERETAAQEVRGYGLEDDVESKPGP